jgi:hypothetical protein
VLAGDTAEPNPPALLGLKLLLAALAALLLPMPPLVPSEHLGLSANKFRLLRTKCTVQELNL